jgi:5,5'-dehydrodivanillate O-demethylase
MMNHKGLGGGGGFYRPFEQYGFQAFEWGLFKTWRYAKDGDYGAEIGGGNPLIFPNILRQQGGATHNMHWRVPIDDTHTNIIVLNFRRNRDGKKEEQPEYPPVEFTPETNPDGTYKMDSFFGQDKMAWETQGRIVDRSKERLGASDYGIVMLRKQLFEGIDAVKEGADPMGTIRDPAKNECIELPGWFVLKTDSLESRPGGASVRDLSAVEGLLNDQQEVFDVPAGSSSRRPRAVAKA